MTRLGYRHYGAQGGDWGSGVTQALATRHAGNLAGIHINMVTAPPDPETMNDLTEQEKGANSAM
jgi:epoxide hydrolase